MARAVGSIADLSAFIENFLRDALSAARCAWIKRERSRLYDERRASGVTRSCLLGIGALPGRHADPMRQNRFVARHLERVSVYIWSHVRVMSAWIGSSCDE